MELMDAFGLPDPGGDRHNQTLMLSALYFTVSGVCSTDLNDQFCMPKLQATPNDFSCGGMTNYLATVGCCAPSLLDLMQNLCNVDKLSNPTTSVCQTTINNINTQINSCKNVMLPKPCAEIKYQLLHHAIVSGVDAAWFAAHQDLLAGELKKVIAYAVGIDPSLILDLTVAPAATSGRRLLQIGDLQVTTTITIPQFNANQAAIEGLQGELESLGVNDAIQSTTPGGSLGNATIISQSTTNIAIVSQAPTGQATSDAYSAAPMLVVVIAAVSLFL